MQSLYWLDVKYANMLSSRLPLFKVKKTSPFLANFRCTVCGDSSTNKLKARAYIYEKDSHVKCTCHNCGYFASLAKFLELTDTTLYSEYRIERLKELGRDSPHKEKAEHLPDLSKINKPRFANFKPLKSLKKISQLAPTHPAVAYVRDNRQIPSKFHYKLFYCPRFFKYVNSLIPNKFEEKMLKHDSPRLIIPLIDENGYCFGFQGRSFDPKDTMRYITIMLDEAKPKVFGLDTVDFTKQYYTLEGPIDSMFVENSIAMVGSDMSLLDVLDKEHQTLVYDNQPRNPEIVKKIKVAIDNNFRVCIWPQNVKGKDINDLIKSGITQDEIMGIIHKNSYRGMTAKVKFIEWKKT